MTVTEVSCDGYHLQVSCRKSTFKALFPWQGPLSWFPQHSLPNAPEAAWGQGLHWLRFCTPHRAPNTQWGNACSLEGFTTILSARQCLTPRSPIHSTRYSVPASLHIHTKVGNNQIASPGHLPIQTPVALSKPCLLTLSTLPFQRTETPWGPHSLSSPQSGRKVAALSPNMLQESQDVDCAFVFYLLQHSCQWQCRCLSCPHQLEERQSSASTPAAWPWHKLQTTLCISTALRNNPAVRGTWRRLWWMESIHKRQEDPSSSLLSLHEEGRLLHSLYENTDYVYLNKIYISYIRAFLAFLVAQAKGSKSHDAREPKASLPSPYAHTRTTPRGITWLSCSRSDRVGEPIGSFQHTAFCPPFCFEPVAQYWKSPCWKGYFSFITRGGLGRAHLEKPASFNPTS